eukprot:CAMPEP_0176496772 /NCGR_PEP_ID=MMETSP0200_2-20121128/11369_1 /TAXON_ID=947934 /ORGANISM="Chaetoceros sp., Strain GSL56" /LENGTH=809 /DNA_ID=CAMNT_0017894741 /DNA_START=464 /DNA_END=2893 /DNA_ORIENTATION=+
MTNTTTGYGISRGTDTSLAATSNHAPPPPPLPTTGLPKIPPTLEGTLHLPTATAAQLVVFYSQVYAYWDEQVKSCKDSGDTTSATYQWAVYYSDLSSRAAHHYNAIKDASTTTTTTTTTTPAGATPTTFPTTRNFNSSATQAATAVTNGPPVSFQNYALDCMRQCSNDTQRNSMKELIEMTIRKSLQDGSMYVKNWKVEPLLPLYQQQQPQQQQQQQPSKSVLEHGTNTTSATGRSADKNSILYGSQVSMNLSTGSISRKKNKKLKMDATTAFTSSSKISSSPSSTTATTKTTNTAGKKSYASIVSNYDSRIDSIATTSPKKMFGAAVSGSTKEKDTSEDPLLLSSVYKSPRKRKQNKMEESSYYGPSCASLDDQETRDNQNSIALEFDTYLSSEPNYISLSSLSSKPGKNQHPSSIKKRKLTTTSPKETKPRNNALKDGFDTSASKLASRANRFSGRGGLTMATSDDLHQEYARGVEKYMGKSVIGGGMSSSSSSWNNGEGKKSLQEEDYEKMTVKGTCQILEKEFLRLTAPPRAELVRPQPVLERHLENICQLRENMKIGKKITSGGQKDYNWFCSQLKAIRQDMTVQRIFDAFAVKVYESHARIALEEGDMNEYNQSQTQLKELYEVLSHNKSSVKEEGNGLKNHNEFIAYRIIYHVFLTGNKKYEGGSSDLFKIMLNLTSEQKSDPLIMHALKIRVAVADNDYYAFFRLRNECTNHGLYLLDKIVPQIRSAALKCTMKAYRPSVATDFILSQLGFVLNHKRQKREAIEWLQSCGCKFSDDQSTILAKESILDEAILTGAQKSSLI